jgi:GntR family transcriptional repressor for pyruvate dehydrogenase complex
MKISTINKTSTPELVVRELLKNIKEGDLTPGEKLPPERNLAESFGVSRSSVREAVSAMVLVGYLEVTQGKGIFLKKDIPSPHMFTSSLSDVLNAYWIMDIIETRQTLECSVVQLAAARADKNDIRKLKETIDRMEKNIENLEGFYEADFDFHTIICEASNNELLSEMVKLVITKTHDQYLKFMPDTLCEPEQAIRTAEKITDCIEKRDTEQAGRIMSEHLNIVPSQLVRLIPEAERYRKQFETIFYSMPSGRNGTE